MKDFIDSIIDWEKFDATVNVSSRISGVTKEHIEQEVNLWQQQIELLEPLDYNKIKKEIDGWDIGVPNLANFESVAATYTRLVNYKVRLGYLLANAHSWSETCDGAIKYIEDLAPGAYSGTGADKKSNAKNIVQPFVHLKNQVSRLENYLEKMHSSVLFCAQQLNGLLIEKQSRAKLNHKLAHEGEELNNRSEEGYYFNNSQRKNK